MYLLCHQGLIVNGFSREWWSHKHNTHHVFPNYVGIDSDIQNDPVFHLWLPAKAKDFPMLRHLQHLYFFPVLAVLYLSWRQQSMARAWAHKAWDEIILMSAHYLMLFTLLPFTVAVGSILLGGFLVGSIVTVTHQAEDMQLPNAKAYCFVTDQFTSTRDVVTDQNFLLEFLWGGMQYQLVHHLFPTLPRYKYRQLRPILQQWAQDNGIEYRVASSAWEMWSVCVGHLGKVAAGAPIDF